jgi:anti-sigma B factor antagonist
MAMARQIAHHAGAARQRIKRGAQSTPSRATVTDRRIPADGEPDVRGEIDIYTAPRLRELLINLVSRGSYQLVVNLDEGGFLDSTGLGVLVGGLRRVRAHDGSLDLVCTQQPILKIFRITGLTEVFGTYETVD